MAKIEKPIRFSEHFNIPNETFEKHGVLNPTLNMDTDLFISPLLLANSSSQEMRKGRNRYETHFTNVINLLSHSTEVGDVAWRNAYRLLQFPEVIGIGLGYSASSTSGSGSGNKISGRLMRTAHDIIKLGMKDNDLFVLLSLLEEGFGADRISDMTANIIIPDIVKHTSNFLDPQDIKLQKVSIKTLSGTIEENLPINPFNESPVLLLPKDILRNLPIANDWSEVADAAHRNALLRLDANRDIAELFKQTGQAKQERKAFALASLSNVTEMMNIIKSIGINPYDFISDADGHIRWIDLIERFQEDDIQYITPPAAKNIQTLNQVVEQIIDQFSFLITERRLSEELFADGKPKHERTAQRIFFAVAHVHCKANNLDITPEADTGNGPVDFKFSSGFDVKALVEIKLSTNSKLRSGYGKQLEKYKEAEETSEGFYVVIDVGSMGKKYENLIAEHNNRVNKGLPVSTIKLIDGNRRPSASNL